MYYYRLAVTLWTGIKYITACPYEGGRRKKGRERIGREGDGVERREGKAEKDRE